VSANRLTRDEILLDALKMAEVPSLNVLDVSNGNPNTGTINPGAMTIGWLQRGVDLFHGRFPWSAVVEVVIGSFTAHNPIYAVPANFILDVKDGLLVEVNGKMQRVLRKPIQNAISLGYNIPDGVPRIYTFSGTSFVVAPTPAENYPGQLWFYGLPAALTGSTIPRFPSDLVLIEFVRVRAMEWIRAAPPGAALRYAETQVYEIRKSGLGNEPENEDVPLDPHTFGYGSGRGPGDNWGWLGEVGT
jgi:hypothetical protein